MLVVGSVVGREAGLDGAVAIGEMREGDVACRVGRRLRHAQATFPQQRLYFFPLPHGHGALRPTF